MKIPITEKFLWDLYKLFLEKRGRSPFHFFLPPYTVRRLIANGEIDAMQEKFYIKYQRRQGKRKFSKFIYYLKKRGYIEAVTWEERKGFILTPKGIGKVLAKQESSYRLPIRSDGRWQMVVFDIPEKSRKTRDRFRDSLKSLGYKQLQKSIWVSPYEVVERTKEIIRSLNIEDDARLFVIDSIHELELKNSERG